MRLAEQGKLQAKGKDHHETSILHHMVSLRSNDKGHTSSKVCGKTVDSPIPTSKGFEPAKPKSKLKIKTGLVEKGDITIRGTITRILIFRANQGT